MALTIYKTGDWVIFDGTDWKQVENSNPIQISAIQAALGGNEILFKGTWDASANEPYLTLARNFPGDFYVVSKSGAIDFTELDEFQRKFTWETGDWVLHDGEEWIKIENKDPIDVSLIPSDVEELIFKGVWDASANSPILTNSTGNIGEFYVVSNEGNMEIVDKIIVPTPKLPPIPTPDSNDGTFGYIGKFTLADLVPDLTDSLKEFSKSLNEFVVPFVASKKAILDAGKLKTKALESALRSSANGVSQATAILDNAKSILDEATRLTSRLEKMLERAGIYSYYYVGPVGNFGSKANELLENGLPGSTAEQDGAPKFGSEELIAAKILIAGSDGGIVASKNRIRDLFGVMGGNAESMVEAFEEILPD